MSSSRGVGLYLTLLLALLCDASEDFLQKEKKLSPEELDFLMLQRPIIPDLSKVLAAGSSEMTQGEDTNFHSVRVPIGRPVFSPRSMGASMRPEVDFPPAFPNAGNLQDICQFSKAPIRYRKDTFPQSGFGREHRQADAVNQLQSWYSFCCGIKGTQEAQICCAEQAYLNEINTNAPGFNRIRSSVNPDQHCGRHREQSCSDSDHSKRAQCESPL